MSLAKRKRLISPKKGLGETTKNWMYGWSFIDRVWFNTTGLREHKHLGKVWYTPTIAEKHQGIFVDLSLVVPLIPVDFEGCTAGSFWFPLPYNETTRRNCRSLCWWVNFPRSTLHSAPTSPTKTLSPKTQKCYRQNLAGGNLRLNGLTTKNHQVATEIFTQLIIRTSDFMIGTSWLHKVCRFSGR